jgi:hypothetical protein
MSRVYAIDERGARFLRYIACDQCGRQTVPGSDDVISGGWVKRGMYAGPGRSENSEVCLCPGCTEERKP